jgi:carbamoyltransferase
VLVLGISGVFGHDAAACLMADGRVVAMMEEERVTRAPHAPGAVPVYSTLYCLQECGIQLGDLDCVAASWNPARDPTARHLAEYLDQYFSHEAWPRTARPRTEYVDHHMAHAASAFFGSGLPEAAVLVVDGNGEDVSTSIGFGRGSSLEIDQSYGVSHSLGQFYTCVTHHLGLGSHAEGKTMGLAAYGRPTVDIDPIVTTDDGYLVELVDVDGLPADVRFRTLISSWSSWLDSRFGEPGPVAYSWDAASAMPRRAPQISEREANIAASAQDRLTSVMVHLARVATGRYRTRSLVIAGGVGLNCSANGAIYESGLVDDLYVVPAAHDAGGALGAAMWVTAAGGTAPRPLASPYLGPAVAQAQTADGLRKLGIPFSEPADVEACTADLLAQGLVVGWMQGRLEIGPRALGNRSILALPNHPDVRDRVNSIKGRELWRPLAPAVLDRDAETFCSSSPCPYMLRAVRATEAARQMIPATVHVDGTMRAQLVTRERNPGFYALLERIAERTGVGAVLNTSFNLSGESIVCNARDAVRSFLSSALDVLVIDGLIVEKVFLGAPIRTEAT